MDRDISIINKIFQQFKPDGVDILLLKIEPTSGGYQYYVSPQYIIDKDNEKGFDLMTIVWRDKQKTDWYTKGDIVFKEFEKDMMETIKKLTGIDLYVRNRGVTEKNYWLSLKSSNDFPKT